MDWGPEHYHRRPEFIKKAQTSLEKNQILGLTGIGGVGKTALAHKLMWDHPQRRIRILRSMDFETWQRAGYIEFEKGRNRNHYQ